MITRAFFFSQCGNTVIRFYIDKHSGDKQKYANEERGTLHPFSRVLNKVENTESLNTDVGDIKNECHYCDDQWHFRMSHSNRKWVYKCSMDVMSQPDR